MNITKIIILVLCIFSICLPSSLSGNEKLYCFTCEKRIKRNRNYYLDSNKNLFCSKKCFQRSLPKCSICKRQETKMLKSSDGNIYCIRCSKLPRCNSCSQISTQTKRLKDGSIICSTCNEEGYTDYDKIILIFNRVREELDKKLGLITPNNIVLKVVDKKELDKRSGQPGQPVSGCYKYEYKTKTIIKKDHLGRIISKKTKIVNKKHTIYVLSHLKLDKLKSVLVHELTHDWHHYHYPKLKDLTDSEGAAQYITWVYCKMNDFPHLAKEVELNRHPVYANGFNRVKAHAQNKKLPGLKSYLDSKYR